MNSVWLKSTMVIHTVLWGLNLTIEWAAYINQEMSSTAEDCLLTVQQQIWDMLQHSNITAEKMNKEERQVLMKRVLRW